DVATHRADGAETISTHLGAGEPQDQCQEPVAVRVPRPELGRIDLAGRAPCAEYGADRRPGADLRAHNMPAARRAEAAVPLSGAVFGRRHEVRAHLSAAVEHREALSREIDAQLEAHGARSASLHAEYGCVTRQTL